MMMRHRLSSGYRWIARRRLCSSDRLLPAILSTAVLAVVLAANPPAPVSASHAAAGTSNLTSANGPNDPAGTASSIGATAHQRADSPNPAFASSDGPSFGQSSYTRSVFENASAGAPVGEPISATFDGDVSYSLGGADGRKFNVDASGQLTTKEAIGDYENSETQKSYSLTVTATADSDASLQTQASVSVTVVNLIEDGESATVGDITWTRVAKTRFLLAHEGAGTNRTRRPGLEINYQPHCASTSRQVYQADMWVDGQQLKARWRLDDEDPWRPVDSRDPDHTGWDAYDLTTANTDTSAPRKGIPNGCTAVYSDVWNDSTHLYAADTKLHIFAAYALSDEGTTITRAPQLDIPLIDDHYTSTFRVLGIWGNSQNLWATQGRGTGGVPRGVAYDRSTFLNVPNRDMAFHGAENVRDAHIAADAIWVQNLNDPERTAAYRTHRHPR